MARPLVALAVVVAMVGLSGCVFVVERGHPTRAEWAGEYASQQASRRDKGRDLALRVRKALNEDPELKSLGLTIFVHRGEVTLCGGFPNPRVRARAFGIVGQLDGVKGVDADCGD